MRRSTALWILIAALGLVVAAGVGAAASQLSSQHVGLSSEPLSAGDRLAPKVSRTARTGRRKATPRKPAQAPAKQTTTPTSPSSTTGPPATVPAPTPHTDDRGKPENEGHKGDD